MRKIKKTIGILIIVSGMFSCSNSVKQLKWIASGFPVQPVRDLHTDEENKFYSINDWIEAGFEDPDEANKWRGEITVIAPIEHHGYTVFSPYEARRWIEAGFDNPEEAETWRKIPGVSSNTDAFIPEEAKLWRKAGFNDPKEAKRWKDKFFSSEIAKEWKNADFAILEAEKWYQTKITPFEAKRWIQNSIRYNTVNDWKNVGFTPENAGKWNKLGFGPDVAKNWKEQGFNPKEANEWWNSGLQNKSQIAKKWRDARLSPKAGYYAEVIGLKIEDIPQEIIKEFQHKKDISADIVLILKLCQINNYDPMKFLKELKRFVKDKCNNKFEDQLTIFLKNPYEIENKCFSLEGKIFQLINKNTGLAKIKNKTKDIVFLDFQNQYAPVIDFVAYGKGVNPLEYNAILGNRNIVHSLQVYHFLKVSPDLKKKLEKLNYW